MSLVSSLTVAFRFGAVSVAETRLELSATRAALAAGAEGAASAGFGAFHAAASSESAPERLRAFVGSAAGVGTGNARLAITTNDCAEI